jgi:hypothetical protein
VKAVVAYPAMRRRQGEKERVDCSSSYCNSVKISQRANAGKAKRSDFKENRAECRGYRG